MNDIVINHNDRILILAPHPDDDVIGAGGLICRYATQCTVVVVTDGEMAIGFQQSKKMREIRKKEFEIAMRKSGVSHYMMLGYIDGELPLHPECFSSIDFSDYTMVFLPNKNENHPDHISTFRYAVEEIIRQGVFDLKVFQYETRCPASDSNILLDITEYIEKKVELIYCHQSQIDLFDHAQFAKSICAYHGCSVGKPGRYFEAYASTIITPNIIEKTEDASLMAKYRKEIEYSTLWLTNLINGLDVAEKLEAAGIKKVGIYGCGKYGKLLFQNLVRRGLTVTFFLDRNIEKKADVPVYYPDYLSDEVDVIIITTLFDHERIREQLQSNGYMKVLTLLELLDDTKGVKKV